jgi:hypothetical protein
MLTASDQVMLNQDPLNSVLRWAVSQDYWDV